jgi:hypothetical protein
VQADAGTAVAGLEGIVELGGEAGSVGLGEPVPPTTTGVGTNVGSGVAVGDGVPASAWLGPTVGR